MPDPVPSLEDIPYSGYTVETIAERFNALLPLARAGRNIITYNDAAGVLADTSPGLAEGTRLLTADGMAFEVAPLAATDHHAVNAGGVKLYVLRGNRPVTPGMFGAVAGGVADATAALQKWLNYGGPLYLDGIYRATAPLTSRNAIITGGGWSTSQIVWDTGEGLVITATNGDATVLQDIALLTKGVAVGTALKLDYSPLISGGVISPRAATHAKLERVRIAGATSYTVDGWLNGVAGVSLLGLDVDSCRINGVYTGAYGTMPQSANGVSFGGSGSPVQLRVSGTYISAWQDGVYTHDAEGIYIHNCELVTVGRGYRCVNAAAESGLFLTDSHIAMIDTGVVVANMAEGVIRGNVLYNVADATPLIGVSLAATAKNITVEGNNFRRLGTVSVYTGIQVAGFDNYIGTNTFSLPSTGTAIDIVAGANRTRVAVQQFITASSAAPIANAGTNSQFEWFRGYTGSLGAIFTDWRMPKQIHTLSTGASDGPTGVSLSGCYVETLCVDANTAMQRLVSPSENNIHFRRRSGGVWSAWVRVALT